MRRRRRRQTVNWFPTLSQEPDLPETCQNTLSTQWPTWLASDFTIGTADCPTENTQLADLTWDFPVEEEVLLNQVPSLADFQGSAWRLRRCVGNLFVAAYDIAGNPGFATPQSVVVGAGLIVLKTDEAGEPLAQTDASYSPLAQKNIRDPWIWRRTWVLQPQAFSTVPNVGPQLAYPSSNIYYGTAVGGPYMDAKTNRRIGLEERLFLAIDGYWRIPPGIQGTGTLINWTFDYRLLGSLMKETNRKNASR